MSRQALQVEDAVIPVDHISSISVEPHFDEQFMQARWAVVVTTTSGKEFFHSRHERVDHARMEMDDLVQNQHSLSWFVVNKKFGKNDADIIDRLQKSRVSTVYYGKDAPIQLQISGFSLTDEDVVLDDGRLVFSYMVPPDQFQRVSEITSYMGPGELPLTAKRIGELSDLLGFKLASHVEYFLGEVS